MLASLQKKLFSALLIASTIALPGCLKPQANQSQSTNPATNPAQTAVLRVSVLPTRNKTDQEKMIAPLEAHLEKVLGQSKEAFLTVPPGLQDIVGTQAIGHTLVQASDYQPMQQLRIQLNLAAEDSK